MLSNLIVVPGGKLGSVDACSTYVDAPATALQLNLMTSFGWNVEYACVGARTGGGNAALCAPSDNDAGRARTRDSSAGDRFVLFMLLSCLRMTHSVEPSTKLTVRGGKPPAMAGAARIARTIANASAEQLIRA